MEKEESCDTISLDTVSSGELELACLACQRDGEYKAAVCFCLDCDEHLCQGCSHVHGKLRTLRGHIILHEIENKKVMVSSSKENKHDHLIIKPNLCAKHPGILVEYYCTCCSVLGCNKCLSTSHEDCRTVRVPDITRYLVQTSDQDDSGLMQGVDDIANSIGAIRDSVRPNLSAMERKHSEVARDVKDVWDYIKELVEAVLKNVADTVMEIKREEETFCRSVTKRADFAMQELTRLTDHSKKVLQGGVSNDDLQSTLEEINRLMLASLGSESEPWSKNHHQCMKSVTDTKRFVESMHEFMSDLELTDIPASRFGDFSLKTDRDKQQCQITGALLSNKNLIVYDRGNIKIKAFNREKKELVAELKLQKDINEMSD